MPIFQLRSRYINAVEVLIDIIYYLNAIRKKLRKNARSLIGCCMDKKHLFTFIDNFVGAEEINADFKLLAAEEHLSKQLAEAEMKSYATILITSAVVAAFIAFICLIIMLHIFIYMRWGITRQLILLNAKICALESRLGTRQLSEELQKKLCEEIGATYKTVQDERQKFAQEIVNEERRMAEELVRSENEPQYETMIGVDDQVFAARKKGDIKKTVSLILLNFTKFTEDHYENIPKSPEVGGVVDQANPKFQTLVGIDNEKFFLAKKGDAGRP
uniref:Uncharacterized protein n=1 Tax=Elaeophora elaphi TaxID=1147741 RepID=A0A0R3RHT9_9BILA